MERILAIAALAALAGCAGPGGDPSAADARDAASGSGARLRVDLERLEPGDPSLPGLAAFIRRRAPRTAPRFYEAALEGPWRARRGAVLLIGELRLHPLTTARVLMHVAESDADPRVRAAAHGALGRLLERQRAPSEQLDEIRLWFHLLEAPGSPRAETGSAPAPSPTSRKMRADRPRREP